MADFGVETCPTEFILAILGHLPLRDVASFSLASKRMLAITQTVLYSDITLEWIPDRKPELSRLIATLLQTLFWQPIFTPFGSWANATSTGSMCILARTYPPSKFEIYQGKRQNSSLQI